MDVRKIIKEELDKDWDWYRGIKSSGGKIWFGENSAEQVYNIMKKLKSLGMTEIGTKIEDFNLNNVVGIYFTNEKIHPLVNVNLDLFDELSREPEFTYKEILGL